MKNPKAVIGAAVAIATAVLLPACATDTNMAGNNVADTEMEQALVTSGFKVRTASTADQRNHIARLPDGQFQAVAQNGNTYYLYADKRDNRLYVGDHWAYRAYKGWVHNRDLRQKGVFVWEVRPADRANNKTIEVWHGWTPFPEWSPSRPND